MTGYWCRPALRGVFAIALLHIALPVTAQMPTTGRIKGIVTDSAGEPLRDVFVTLVESATRLRREKYSDRFGDFSFGFLEPGEYGLTIEKLGYSPRRISRIPVRPGGDVQVRSTLPAVRGGQIVGGEEVVERAALGGSPAATGQWVPLFALRSVPAARREVTEAARLTSQSSDDLVVEGLPPWLSRLAIDGTPFTPARHPYLWAAPYRTTGFTLSSVSGATLVANGLDVEWAGAAGAFLSAHSQRGALSSEGEVRGHWSGSVLPGPSFVDGSSLTYNDIQGSITFRGPVLSDSGRAAVGVDISRLETPVSPAWVESPGAAALVTAGEGAGLQLNGYRSASVSAAHAVSAFGRFDWAIARRHQLGGWLQFASLPKTPGYDPLTGTLPVLEGNDLLAGMNLVSALNTSTDNHLRVSITTSLRETAETAPVGPTTIVSEGLSFGGARTAARADETRVHLSDALHVSTRQHALKFGVAADDRRKSLRLPTGSGRGFLLQWCDGLDDAARRHGSERRPGGRRELVGCDRGRIRPGSMDGE